MKKTNNKNREKADSYKTGFLKQTGLATAGGGQAYMRPEYHDRISEIITLFGENGMTVEDYLDNVLTAHFAQCQEAADALPSNNAHRKRNRSRDGRREKRPFKGQAREITPDEAEGLLATFLEASEIKTRQCVYIDRDTHRKISDIVKYLGDGLSIGKYVDNVLRDHIGKYRELYSFAFGNVKPVEL